MGPLTKQQKRVREQLKNSTNGRFTKLVRTEENNEHEILDDSETTVEDDFEILAALEVSEAIEPAEVIRDNTKPIYPIKWNESEASSSRGKYWGNSKNIKYYREEQALKKKKGSHEITDFFKKAVMDKNLEDNEDNGELETLSPLMTIQEAYDQLTSIVAPIMNVKKDDERAMRDYELRKYSGVHAYFGELLRKTPVMKASQIAAKTVWITPSNHYRARAIRSYANEYLRYGKISPHQQGKRIKRVSLLSNEDIKEAAQKWIVTTKVEKRGIPELLKYLNYTVVLSIFNLPGNISASVLWNYMVEWGYSYRTNKKILYYDGHERADVVEYRKEWASKMVQYSHFMEIYDENDVTKVTPPILPEGQKQVVMVTQDESTFYSNESPANLWLLKDENPIRNKSPGRSIMVSEFQCPCHGTMRIKNWKSRKLFFAGTNRDEYWTWKDMREQLEDDVIPLFERLHPGCQALFLLDQSSNHNAYAPSAKRVNSFNLKDTRLDSINQRVILPGYYIGIDGERKIQNFYALEIKNEGKKNERRIWYRKGVETILKERGLGKWDEYKAQGKYWKAKCGNKEPNSDHSCCPYHMLENQPDFRAQKTALEELVTKSGHLYALYPKYHCETNWIERYWSAAKRIARRECDYSFKALQENLDGFLDQVSPQNTTPVEIR